MEPRATVHTDGWRGYWPLSETDHEHVKKKIMGSGDLAHVVMPRVHRVSSLLKRWLLGTHQGRVRPEPALKWPGFRIRQAETPQPWR